MSGHDQLLRRLVIGANGYVGREIVSDAGHRSAHRVIGTVRTAAASDQTSAVIGHAAAFDDLMHGFFVRSDRVPPTTDEGRRRLAARPYRWATMDRLFVGSARSRGSCSWDRSQLWHENVSQSTEAPW